MKNRLTYKQKRMVKESFSEDKARVYANCVHQPVSEKARERGGQKQYSVNAGKKNWIYEIGRK